MTDKEKVLHLIDAGGSNIKVAFQLLKGMPKLKQNIEAEMLPILQSIGKKNAEKFT